VSVRSAPQQLFDHIIDHGELSERRASLMFHDAIQGLAHLHARKICHLDIKPENLLLTSTKEDAKVKIADFGLAITMQDNERCEACVGTPAYWAPEMVRREPFGRPVDIWALGCVLYIMLVGTHPFDPEGDSPEAHILARVTEGDYDKESTQYKQLSNTVKDLIRHMLDPNHRTRYTADKVLAHPWLKHADQLSDAPLTSSHISNLRGFRVLHLLKR
jgi:serine/threonine protein kinase